MILMDVVTFMLHNFGLSNSYGDEYLLTRNYFQNRTPTKALDDTNIHIDLWIGVKPKFKSFENVQMCFSIVQKDLRKKLVLDTIEYILFGYNEENKSIDIY